MKFSTQFLSLSMGASMVSVLFRAFYVRKLLYVLPAWTMIQIIATSDGLRSYENTTIITKISDILPSTDLSSHEQLLVTRHFVCV